MKLQSQFGGELLIGKRKVARPISTKHAMHTTLRSETHRSFLLPKNAAVIRNCLVLNAKKFGIQIYEYSINSNHIHLLTRARSRHGFKAFLKALSGMIAMKLSGSKKGRSLKSRFWALRPWSRIVVWGRAFINAKNYVIRNQLESTGIIRYTPRKSRLVKSTKPVVGCVIT